MNIQSFKYFIKSYISVVLFLPIAITLISCKSSDIRELTSQLQQSKKPLDSKTVVAGLKQALEVSTRNSVAKTSKVGGFSDNPLIHIAIPQELRKVESSLKKIGLGRHVDKFETQMNRAAESASKEATRIFIASITKMTFSDAWNILQGPDDAATQYFKQNTSAELSSKFKPVIKNSMGQIGFYDNYKNMLKTYQAIPFTKKPDLNIETYILQKSLDGLFTLVAQEEKMIRRDPAARVTDLLSRVFGE